MWNKEEILSRQNTVIEWLRKKCLEAGTKGLVCGLSGGVDSAVVAGLCQKAFPEASLGVIMPCHSLANDREDAFLVARTLGIEVMEVDLSREHTSIYGKIEMAISASDISQEARQMSQGNLKARLRMAALYTVANLRNYLVVGTDNAPESYIGYFTKYGDGGVDLLPISSLSKAEVRAWARALGLPESIASRPPSAGLWPGQTDEEEIGLSYEVIDRYLLGEKVTDSAVQRIERMHTLSAHKRQTPYSIDLPKLERLD